MNDTTLIIEAIKRGVEREVRPAFDALKAKLIEDLDRKKDEICAGVVLHVTKHIRMETIGQELVITIKKIEDKK